MPTVIVCPTCEAQLKLPQGLKPGTALICPKCHESIRVPEADTAAVAVTARPKVRPAPPPSAVPDVDDDDDRSDEEEYRPRSGGRKKAKKAKGGVFIGLGVILVAVLGGVVAAAVAFWPSDKPKQAFVPPPFPGPQQAFVPGGPADPRFGPAPVMVRPPRAGGPVIAEPDPEPPPAPAPPTAPAPPPPPAPTPAAPRSLDWAGLNVAGVSVGEVAARSPLDLDALRYLPPQSDTVIGVDVGSLGTKLVLGWLMQKIAVLGDECPLDTLERDTGLQLSEIDHIVIAGAIDFRRENWAAKKPFPVEATTYVIKTRSPLDRVGLLQRVRADGRKQSQGKEYYPLPSAGKNKLTHLYMPSDTVLVVSTLPESQFTTILALDGTRAVLASESLAALKALGQCHAWVVLPSAQMKALLPAGAPVVVALQPGIDAAATARAVGVSLRFRGDQVNLGLAVAVADRGLATTLQDFWNKQGKRGLLNATGKVAPGFHAALTELAQGVQWQNQAGSAAAFVPIHFKAVDELLKAAE